MGEKTPRPKPVERRLGEALCRKGLLVSPRGGGESSQWVGYLRRSQARAVTAIKRAMKSRSGRAFTLGRASVHPDHEPHKKGEGDLEGGMVEPIGSHGGGVSFLASPSKSLNFLWRSRAYTKGTIKKRAAAMPQMVNKS